MAKLCAGRDRELTGQPHQLRVITMTRPWRLLGSLPVLLCSYLLPIAAQAAGIAVIVSGESSAYKTRFVAGATQASIELNVDLKTYTISAPYDDDKLIEAFKSAAEINPIGIVIEPETDDRFDAFIRSADVHTNVIVASPAPRSESAAMSITWDETYAGKLAADSLARAVIDSTGTSSGHVVLVKPNPSNKAIDDRAVGFVERLSKKYPGLTVISSDAESGQVGPTTDAIKNIITSDQKLVGVFAPEFALTIGSALAIQKYDTTGKIQLIGTWQTSAQKWSSFSSLKDYPVLRRTTFVVQDAYWLGYNGVTSAVDKHNGKDFPRNLYVQAAATISGGPLSEALKNWSQVAGPGLVADDRVLPILYMTNRTLSDQEKQEFTGDLDNEQHFGIAFVRVPEKHRFGTLERTNWDTSTNEYDTTSFVIKKKKAFSEDRFKEAIIASTVKTAVIFVPGYKNNFDDGLFRFAQLIWDGQLNDMIPVFFSWPSRDDVGQYEYDGESATNSVIAFKKLIELLQNDCSIDDINIIAHSMGNRVVVSALAELSADHRKKPSGELVLAAADVNSDQFLQRASLMKQAAHGVTIYASASDRALELSSGIAQMPRIGKINAGGPVVVGGVDSIDVTVMGDDLFSWNHDTYAGSSVIEDIARLIRFGTRPPNIRTPRIRGIPEGSDQPLYWRYSE
jgi:esterase/lipase superfamily enzyme/ABC-type sugar transport system substrate-binding protein